MTVRQAEMLLSQNDKFCSLYSNRTYPNLKFQHILLVQVLGK